MLDSNSETLRRVLKADLHLASFDNFCWSAQVSNAFNGLQSSAMFKQKMLRACQVKLRSLQSIRLSTSTDLGAFGPRKASKVEKPSNRGVSSLHRWSLMLLPVLWPMPLCALCTHVCLLLCVYSALGRRHTAAPSRSWDP